MIIFDVYVNDRKLCRAGVGRDGVLDAIVSWAKLKGPAAATARRLKQPLEEARLHVGGLRDDTFLTWSDRKLRAGDRVAIAVGKEKTCDPPARQRRRVPAEDEQRERDYYLRLKRKFEPAEDPTSFLNVDLDIFSSSPLDPLVRAFGKSAHALWAGNRGRGREYSAHLELAFESNSADRLIRRFVREVQKLPREARSLWDRARAREFNIGIQAGGRPHCFDLGLEPETLQAAASVNARIRLSVYGAALPSV